MAALPVILEHDRRQGGMVGRTEPAYRGEVEDSWDGIRSQVRAYADHVAGEIE
jgi:hypothetical protein